jgi:Stress responsive A/B Barrel Domain
MQDDGPAIQHVVLFTFPEELTPDEEREMADRIRGWPDEIGGFTELRFGRDITGARTRGYQYLLFTQFPNERTMKDYLVHPVHRAFADWVHERGSQEIAFDYLLTPATMFVAGSLAGP